MQTFSLAIKCTLNLAVNFAEIKESPILRALLSAKACAVLEMSLFPSVTKGLPRPLPV